MDLLSSNVASEVVDRAVGNHVEDDRVVECVNRCGIVDAVSKTDQTGPKSDDVLVVVHKAVARSSLGLH